MTEPDRVVTPSGRVSASSTMNEITRVKRQLDDEGVEYTNLSDFNPTRHGLLHPAVLERVASSARAAGTYDPDPRGPLPAREALAARFGGDPGDYWLTGSTSQAYQWLFALLADPGDAVAIPQPCYPLIEPIARLTGLRSTEYRWHYVHGDGWILDPSTLTAAVSAPDVRAVVAVNPGNPTGSYLQAEDVTDTCLHRGVPLIADEVFAPFDLDGLASTLTGSDGVVTFTLGGLSKLLCAPQLKLSWIRITGPATDLAPVWDALDLIADTFLPVSGPVAAALPDLLDVTDESVATSRRRLETNLAAARAILEGSRYRVRQCEGGWTVLVDVPAEAAVEGLAVAVLRRAHLEVHPGWFYDIPDDSALALSLLPRPEIFADGLRRLVGAVDDLIDSSGGR